MWLRASGPFDGSDRGGKPPGGVDGCAVLSRSIRSRVRAAAMHRIARGLASSLRVLLCAFALLHFFAFPAAHADSDYDLRIRPGPEHPETRGRLEILVASSWRAICDGGFTDVEAGVACRQLGYSGGVNPGDDNPAPSVMSFFLDDVRCQGTESRLIDCAHRKPPPAGLGCEASEAVSVSCTPPPPDPAIVVPVAATDLSVSNPTATSLDVSWTLPAQDDDVTLEAVEIHEWKAISYLPHIFDWVRLATLGATATSHTLTELGSGESFRLRVRLVDETGGTADSPSVRGHTLPDRPTRLSATAADASAFLAWQAPFYTGGYTVTGYEYRVSADSGATWSPGWTAFEGTAINSYTFTHTITGLTNDVEHTIALRSVTSYGPGSSRSVDVTPEEGPVQHVLPDAPQRLATAVSTTAPTARLTWVRPRNFGTGIHLRDEYRVSADGGTTWAPDWTASGAELGLLRAAIVLTDLHWSTSYTFEVRVVTSAGAGDAVRGTATTIDDPSLPGAVATLTLTPADGALELSWQPPASPGASAVTAYEHRVRLASTGALVHDWASVAAIERSATVTGLENGVAHDVDVRALNASGAGPATTARATPENEAAPVLECPSAVPANAFWSSCMTIGWDPESGSAGFNRAVSVDIGELSGSTFTHEGTHHTVDSIIQGNGKFGVGFDNQTWPTGKDWVLQVGDRSLPLADAKYLGFAWAYVWDDPGFGWTAADAGVQVTASLRPAGDPLTTSMAGSVPDADDEDLRRPADGCRVDVAVEFLDGDGTAVAVDALSADDFTVDGGRVGTPVADEDGLGWTVPAWSVRGSTGLMRVTLGATGRWQVGSQVFRVSGDRTCASAAKNELASFALDGLELDPAFAAGTTAYRAEAAADKSQVTVTAAAVDGDAEVSISPGDADTETDDHQVALAEGDNAIAVTVTPADDDVEARTYTVTVTRAADPGVLTGFVLVDASTDTDLDPITDGGTVSVSADGSYGVRAEVAAGADIGSVVMMLLGPGEQDGHRQTENLVPYSLYGDANGAEHGRGLPAGSYTLTATAHAERRGSGTVLDTLSVPFSVEVAVVPPGAPTGVSAVAGDREVALSWTAPEYGGEITGWQVRRGETEAGTGSVSWGVWGDIEGSDAETAAHTVTGLVNGTSYSFELRALAGEVEGTASAPAAATPADPDATRSGAVALDAEAESPRSHRGKSLDRAAGDAVDYYTFTLTERKRLGLGIRDASIDVDVFLEDSEGNRLGQSRPRPDDASEERLDAVLDAGTYYIRVEAMEDGTTEYHVRFGLDAPPSPVAASGLSATNPTQTSVDLAWTLPEQPAGVTVTGVEVHEANSEVTWAWVVTRLAADATAQTMTQLIAGTSYRFRIRLLTNVGHVDSEPVTARTTGGDVDATRDGATTLDVEAALRRTWYLNDRSLDRAGGDAVDYYVFTLAQAKELGLGVRGQSIDLDVLLEDAHGNRLGQSWPPPVDASVEWLKMVLEPGTYHVRVEAMEDGATSYYIRFGLKDPAVAVSVADARAEEGTDATIDFRVTLDRAATRTVTVDYATADGTATAGADYTATSGTLHFVANETEKTVSVPVLDDGSDEGEETLVLRLTNPQGAALGDGEAVGTISNDDPLQRMWLSRFGRTVASQVVDAVSDRLSGPLARTQVTVGGQTLALSREDDEAVPAEAVTGSARAFGPREEPAFDDRWSGSGAWLDHRGGAWENRRSGTAVRTMSGRDAMLGSAFNLASDGEAGGPGLAAWGRVTVVGFDGAGESEGRTPMRIDGDVTTGILGADAAWDRWLTGVAVSLSESEGTFDQPGVDSGTLESSLTTVTPYARVSLNDRLSTWGLLGYGTGDMTIVHAARGEVETRTDLEMRLGAVGARGALLQAGDEGGLDLALEADALLVETESAKAPDSAATTAGASRVRLALEGSRAFEMGEGMVFTPGLEVGLRHDGGDAESGTGVEVGGRVAWANPRSGLTMEANVRALIAHEDSAYEEWGASGSVRLNPGAKGRGLSLTVAPAWGMASSRVERLWSAPDARGLAPNGVFEPESRLDTELGYGLGVFGSAFTATPYAGLGSSASGRDWRLGYRLVSTRHEALDLSLGLEGTLSEPAGDDAPPERGNMLRGSVRW